MDDRSGESGFLFVSRGHNYYFTSHSSLKQGAMTLTVVSSSTEQSLTALEAASTVPHSTARSHQ
jgi:hypothetical protein